MICPPIMREFCYNPANNEIGLGLKTTFSIDGRFRCLMMNLLWWPGWPRPDAAPTDLANQRLKKIGTLSQSCWLSRFYLIFCDFVTLCFVTRCWPGIRWLTQIPIPDLRERIMVLSITSARGETLGHPGKGGGGEKTKKDNIKSRNLQ